MNRHTTPYVAPLEAPAPAEAACEVGATPWGEGYDSCKAGEPLDSCPYEVDTETYAHAEYVAGWWDCWTDLNSWPRTSDAAT